jgi:hypothetical protein
MSSIFMYEDYTIFYISSELAKNIITLYNPEIIYELLTEDQINEYLVYIIKNIFKVDDIISPNLRSSENVDNDMVDFNL